MIPLPNKKRKMKRTKQLIAGVCFAVLACVTGTGCSKDDKPGTNKKISMKFTVTVNGASSDDQVDFQFGAGNHDASQYGGVVWKINGVAQGNENVIALDEQKFLGSTKTYVVETVTGFNFGNLVVRYSNAPGGSPLTISYKAEIDGKVQTNVETLSVAAGQSDNKNYTYQ
jgi:hypothetical protein